MRMAWLGVLCLTVLVLGCDRLLPLQQSPDSAADQSAHETNTIRDAPVPFDAVLTTDGRPDGSRPDLMTRSIDLSIKADIALAPDTLQPGCSPATCPGCCDFSTNQCHPGNTASACGTGNTKCKACPLGQSCINGTCQVWP